MGALAGLVDDGDGVLLLGLDDLPRAAFGILADAGLELLRVTETPEAVALIDGGRAQVVLADARQGPVLIEAARALPEMADVHVVVLVDLESPDELRAALDAGADDVMRVPFEPEVLAARVAAGLRAARLRAERGAAALAGGQHPGRHLPLRVRSRLDDAVAERRDRGDLRLPGERLHRQRGAHVRQRRSIPTTASRSSGRSWTRSPPDRPFTLEYRHRAPRRRRALGARARPGAARPATAARWLDGAIFDITARRAAEQALREREIVEAQLAEVRASRARILEAADRARREIERNLHDGAQQRLSPSRCCSRWRWPERSSHPDPPRGATLLQRWRSRELNKPPSASCESSHTGSIPLS